jgi:zinc/manganese transport system permease protein
MESPVSGDGAIKNEEIMGDFIQIMFWPLCACLVLTGIHAYLGFHVIERGVIFVDLALAQMAALGIAVGLANGMTMDNHWLYVLAFGFTMFGAIIFSLTRQQQRLSQEVIIGICYAFSWALVMVILSRSGMGEEHIRQLLMGNILLVNAQDVILMGGLYVVIGVIHMLYRQQFFALTRDGQQGIASLRNKPWWDLLFYASFGLVVTSSVKVAGVLMVFAFLMIPAASAVLLYQKTGMRLVFAWSMGTVASMLGMSLSFWGDFPTAPSVVITLGVCFMLSWVLATRINKSSLDRLISE